MNSDIIGKKFDSDKPDWSLVPSKEMEDVVRVLTLGLKKYSRDNWKHVENGMNRYYAAFKRHANWYKKYMETGDPKALYDAETGIHHLAHAACNLLFLMWLDNNDAHTFSKDEIPSWWVQKIEQQIEDALYAETIEAFEHNLPSDRVEYVVDFDMESEQ